MTNRLIDIIKIVAVVLTSLNLVGFSCSLYLESFNYSSLLLTITLQMLVIITYLIVIIYSKWVSEHFSSLNANQTQFAEELKHLNKALNEESQLIKSHINTQANNFKVNSEEAFGKMNEENERLLKEFSLLIEKVENNRDGFDKKQKEIIDKIDVEHSNAVLRNKTTIENISQLRPLLNGAVEELQTIIQNYSNVINVINEGNNQLNVSILQTDKSVNEGLKVNQNELSELKTGFIDAQKREIVVIREVLENQLQQIDHLQNISAESLNDKLEKLHHKVEKHNISFNSIIKNNQSQDLEVLIEKLNELPRISKEIQQIPLSLESSLQKQKKEINKSILTNSTINYERIDALLSIHKFIDLKAPLPIMHDWRVSSDYAHAVISTILEKKNGSVIDIGSGISTLLFAYAVKQNGNGKVISLEHSKKYFEETKKLIELHDLEDFCELYFCPLIEYKLNDEKWSWYDINNISFPDNISVISVDGPPGSTQALARYPAIPLLKNQIKNGTKIFLDDAYREEEEMIAMRWKEEFKLNCNFVKAHKGLFLLE
jgi:hypothetical protein